MGYRAWVVLAVGVVMAAGLTGCLDDPSVRCADGTVCPDGTTCVAIVGTTHCVTPAQAAACAGGGDGAICDLTATADGVCHAGVCVRSGCQDGFLSPGEKCDGAALGGEDCLSQGFYAGDLGCTAACDFDTSACVGTCGDGEINGDEQCDGAALGGADCTDGGYYQAPGLGCAPTCRFDFGGCGGGRCGDGVINGTEACDPARPVDAEHDRCDDAAFGFYNSAAVTCNAICQYDTAACAGRCGDDVKNGPEECDGGDTGGLDCQTLPGHYYGGNLNCLPSCQFDDFECRLAGRCGDGIYQDGPEECDQGDFGGQSCQTGALFDVFGPGPGLPRYGGRLECRADCTIDTAGTSTMEPCVEYCGDGVLNGPEPCDAGANGMPDDTADDRYLGDATCRSFGYQFGALMCVNACTTIDLAGCSGRCGDGVLQGDEACDGAVQQTLDGSCGVLGEHGALGCDSYCQLETRACEATSWSAVSVTGTPGAAILAMWSAGPGDVWAVLQDPSTQRTVIHGDGSTWAVVPSPFAQPTALAGAGAQVWLGDASGAVVARAAMSWTALGRPSAGAITHLWGDATRLFAAVSVGGVGEVWRWTGATAWTRETPPVALTTIAAVRGLAGDRVYVLGTSGATTYLLERAAVGTWTSSVVPSGFYRDLWVGSAEQIWALGGTSATAGAGDSLIARRVRGAWTTTALTEQTPMGTQTVKGTVVGAGGEVDNLWLAGADNGRSWLINSTGDLSAGVTRIIGAYPAFTGVADSDHGDLWAFGGGLLVAHRDGSGWATPYLPGAATDPASTLARFTASNNNAVAVAGADVWIAALPAAGATQPLFLVRHRADQPLGEVPDARWTTPLVGVPIDLVVARAPDDVWAFARMTAAARRWNGVAWATETPPFPVGGISAATAIGGALYVAVGGAARGLWRYSTTSGWTALPPWPGGFDAAAIGGTGATDLWLGGVSGTVARWSGVAWTSVPQSTLAVRGLWAASADDVWALGAVADGARTTGVILHKGPADAAFVRLTDVPGVPGTLDGIWGSGPSDLWVVGELGTILHYDGLQWVPVTTTAAGPQRGLLAIAGASRDEVWAVGGGGSLFRVNAALPPSAPAPCADAIPLYCSGLAVPPSATARPLYGTIPVGGRAIYRLDPPFEANLDASATAGAGVTLRLQDADTLGACLGPAGAVPLPATVAGHRTYYLELTAPAATTATGYQLAFTCAPTTP